MILALFKDGEQPEAEHVSGLLQTSTELRYLAGCSQNWRSVILRGEKTNSYERTVFAIDHDGGPGICGRP
jgi:hypothetical protein